METKDFLKLICREANLSGFESNVTEIIKKEFSKYCDEVSVDKAGKLIALKKGKQKGKKKGRLMYAAHTDQVGMMITHIDKKGFLKFTTIGLDQRVLVGQEVYVMGTKKILGVIGVKPPHLVPEAEKSVAVKTEDLSIDCGYGYEEISKLVKPGDAVIFKSEVKELMNNQVAGRGMDDCAGVAVLLECMKNLKHVNHDHDVYFVGTVQEEVGCRGAITSTYNINPDIAIAVDVGFARTPELDELNSIEMDKGVGIGFGPNMHPNLYKKLRDVCKDNKIPNQVVVLPTLAGTDARVMQISREGVAVNTLAIPLKYMHTPIEVVSMSDLTETARLLSCFTLSMNGLEVEELLCL